jgi:uncharacterized protein (DUF305 family)
VRNKHYAATLAAIAAVVTVGACSNSGSDSQASPTNSPAASATSSPPDVAETHNEADVMFAQGMIPHHEQAIEMSDMLLAKQGVDPRVASLAKDIKAAQTPEIDQMQGWLTQWNDANTTTTSPSSSMPGHDMSGGDMPGMSGGHGMMSEQDMTALQNANGAEASRLFLSQMIEHHNGAIMMAQQEIKDGQFPAAVALARSIIDAQKREISTMQGILDSM